MKPLYRFYMNLGITVIFGSIIFAMFHFGGPPALLFLVFLIPIACLVYGCANSAH